MGLPLPLLNLRRRLAGGISPAALFLNSEPGVWYDPSDLTTMFQDRAGTTLVTTPGQSVGYIRDKSGNNFHLTATADASRGTYGIEPFGGRRNLLTFTEQFENAAWVNNIGGTGVAPVRTANFAVSPIGDMTADRLQFSLNGGTTTNDISRLSITHQALTIGLPYTISFWARLNTGASATINLQETSLSATQLSVTDQWQRLTYSATAGVAGTSLIFGLRGGQSPANSDTVDLLIWGAQVEVGSTATPYQRVTTAFDVTEAGVPTVHYVQFDGADDGYLTSTITPGTDRAQVFAGVRKLSDATLGTIVEHSTNSATSNGALALLASAASNPNYVFRSRGTTSTDATAPSSYAAPITNVVTGLGDISGDRSTIRVNGSQVAQNVNDQGTGNYLAYPLYIGRRGGSSLPFNGRLYQMVVRFGPNLDAARIAQVERFINSKTGAY